MDGYIKVSTAMACAKEARTDRPYDTGKSQYEAGWDDACNYIRNCIDIQCPEDVEPTRRWIPCSERLPELETEVLAVCRWGSVSFVCPAMYEDGKMLTSESIWNWNEIEGYGLYSEDADDWFIPEGWWEYRHFNDDDVYNNVIDCAVTHWMPLPEPPKEGDAEK